MIDGSTLAEAAQDVVVRDPEILGGMPVIRGMRVLVYDVAASVASGDSMDEILLAYPSLQPDQVDLAVMYATVHPPQPNLRRVAELPQGAKVIKRQTIRHTIPPE